MRTTGRSAQSGLIAVFALLLVTGLSGCIALQTSTEEDEGPRDIRWFTDALMEEGIIIRERGPAASSYARTTRSA